MSVEEIGEATKPIICIRVLTIVALVAAIPLLMLGLKSWAIASFGVIFVGAELGRSQSLSNPK